MYEHCVDEVAHLLETTIYCCAVRVPCIAFLRLAWRSSSQVWDLTLFYASSRARGIVSLLRTVEKVTIIQIRTTLPSNSCVPY